MTLNAGKRLKGFRVLLRLSQDELASIIGVSLSRLQNVENGKSKMSETEFAAADQFPNFLAYLAYEGEISLSALKRSPHKLEKLALANYETNLIPTGYLFEEKIQ